MGSIFKPKMPSLPPPPPAPEPISDEISAEEKERIAKANTARQVVMEEARQRGDNPSAGSFSSNSPGGISQQTSRDARGGMSGWGLRDGGLATMFTRRR